MSADYFLLRIPGVARFLLFAGREIVCEPEARADTDDIAIFVLGTVMGILLHQRGQIVLHASASEVDGKAILFCGRSGAGKSTMAAALAQRGYACLTDDLCAITIDNVGRAIAHSDGRQIKLWEQSIKHLNMGEQSTKRVRRQIEKYYVDHHRRVSERALPVGVVYALHEARPVRPAAVEQPNVVDSAALVHRHAYRPLLVARMGQRGEYFKVATTIAKSAGVYRLSRPMGFDEIPNSIAQLQRHWAELGLLSGGIQCS